MDEQQLKHVVEAALLAAGRPLALDKLLELFTSKGLEVEKQTVRGALEALETDYAERGIQIKEVASGYRIQIKSSMQDWLQPLWEERAPRYTRALLETLALIAYRQPITRAEIEEVRGVAVSSNIVRTLMERGWVRVVGYRDVPGKPSMLGTTREFLDYFGLKRLEDLPPLADIKDGYPELSPQSDFLDSLASAEDGQQVQVPLEGQGQAIEPGSEPARDATDQQHTERQTDQAEPVADEEAVQTGRRADGSAVAPQGASAVETDTQGTPEVHSQVTSEADARDGGEAETQGAPESETQGGFEDVGGDTEAGHVRDEFAAEAVEPPEAAAPGVVAEAGLEDSTDAQDYSAVEGPAAVQVPADVEPPADLKASPTEEVDEDDEDELDRNARSESSQAV